jgi:hypothetical protein
MVHKCHGRGLPARADPVQPIFWRGRYQRSRRRHALRDPSNKISMYAFFRLNARRRALPRRFERGTIQKRRHVVLQEKGESCFEEDLHRLSVIKICAAIAATGIALTWVVGRSEMRHDQ